MVPWVDLFLFVLWEKIEDTKKIHLKTNYYESQIVIASFLIIFWKQGEEKKQ